MNVRWCAMRVGASLASALFGQSPVAADELQKCSKDVVPVNTVNLDTNDRRFDCVVHVNVGKVRIEFTVDPSGKTTDLHAYESEVDPQSCTEAVTAVAMQTVALLKFRPQPTPCGKSIRLSYGKGRLVPDHGRLVK